MTFGISTDNEDVFTIYVSGLHRQIQNELRLHASMNISNVSRIAMAIDLKNKNGGLKMEVL